MGTNAKTRDRVERDRPHRIAARTRARLHVLLQAAEAAAATRWVSAAARNVSGVRVATEVAPTKSHKGSCAALSMPSVACGRRPKKTPPFPVALQSRHD
jgi:hypothetical protein